MKCELCREEQSMYDYIYKNDEEKYILRLSAGWNEHLDDFDYSEIEVQYCPNCGRKL